MNRSLSLVSSIALLALAPSFLLLLAPAVRGGNEIPKTAWKRPLGLPLENPGVKRGALPWVVSAPERFQEPIEAILRAGI